MAEIIRQCDAGHLSLNAENWECPWCENARLERLQQHMVINEFKIEEQTREIELLHSALNNLARQRDVAEQQVERLRADITWQEERNAMNVKVYSDDNNTLWAALKDMQSQHMPSRLYPLCDCKGCNALKGENHCKAGKHRWTVDDRECIWCEIAKTGATAMRLRAEKAEEDNKSLLYRATTAEADLEEVKAEFRRAKERFNTALKGDE